VQKILPQLIALQWQNAEQNGRRLMEKALRFKAKRSTFYYKLCNMVPHSREFPTEGGYFILLAPTDEGSAIEIDARRVYDPGDRFSEMRAMTFKVTPYGDRIEIRGACYNPTFDKVFDELFSEFARLWESSPAKKRAVDVFTKEDEDKRRQTWEKAMRLHNGPDCPTWKEIARLCGVTVRTLRNYRKRFESPIDN
jgi:hypothetical protein